MPLSRLMSSAKESVFLESQDFGPWILYMRQKGVVRGDKLVFIWFHFKKVYAGMIKWGDGGRRDDKEQKL